MPGPIQRGEGEGVVDAVRAFLSGLGELRYGMTTAEKEALAASGQVPGAPVDNSADQARSNRYASGYYFGKQWPRVSTAVMPVVNRIKTSDLPLLGGSSPELQSLAAQGQLAGKAAAEEED